MGVVRIRRRERHDASPRAGLDAAWTEWQVVVGRCVVSRHDTETQAELAAAALRQACADPGASPSSGPAVV